jgi:hypothetical protein
VPPDNNPSVSDITLLLNAYDNVASRLTETLLLTGQILKGQNTLVTKHTDAMDKLALEIKGLSDKIESAERTIKEKQVTYRGESKDEHTKISMAVKMAWLGLGSIVVAALGVCIKVITLLDDIETIEKVLNIVTQMAGGG